MLVVVGREPVALHVSGKRALQLQRHRNGFCCVLGGVRHRYGVERDLLASGAGQLGQRLQLHVQPVESERLERERLLAGKMRREHRVERDAHLGRRQPVLGKQREREVEIVAGDGFAPEHRQQDVQGLFGGQLLPFRVAYRNVEPLALVNGERQPGEFRLHRAGARGVRLYHECGCGAQACNQRFERGRSVHGCHPNVRLEHRLRFDGGSVSLWLLLVRLRRDARDEAAELQLAEHVQHVVPGEPTERRLVEIETRGRGGRNRHKELALEQLLGVLPHEALDPGRRHLVHALDERLRAAELVDELHRCLLADAGNAGDVVGRIAGERLHVALLRGFEPAVALAYGVLVVDACIAEPGGEQHPDVRRDELQRVRVAGGDERVHAVLRAPCRDRAQHVVGLVAGRFEDGNAKGVHHLLHALHVAGQFWRDGGTVGLVLRVQLIAESALRRIERDGGVRGPVVGKGLEECGGEGVDAPYVLAGRADGERLRLPEREPRAEDHRVPVHEQQQGCLPLRGGGLRLTEQGRDAFRRRSACHVHTPRRGLKKLCRKLR